MLRGTDRTLLRTAQVRATTRGHTRGHARGRGGARAQPPKHTCERERQRPRGRRLVRQAQALARGVDSDKIHERRAVRADAGKSHRVPRVDVRDLVIY